MLLSTTTMVSLSIHLSVYSAGRLRYFSHAVGSLASKPNLTNWNPHFIFVFIAIGKEAGTVFNHKIVQVLRGGNPDVFTLPVVYDGRKNLYSPYRLELGDQESRTVCSSVS